jgi:hypothetical protein
MAEAPLEPPPSTTPEGRLSPLELLLPPGLSRNALLLGSNCPAVLRPSRGGAAAGEQVGLVVIAPSKLEGADRTWLARNAKHAAAMLDERGIVYVIATPRLRGRVRRALRKEGFERVEAFLHVPDLRRSTFLVPLRRQTLRHAFAHLVPVRSRNRALAALVTALPSTSALELVAGPVGFAARRAKADPDLFDWLQEGDAAATAILGVGAKDAERLTLHVFPPSARSPSLIAKVGGGPERHSGLAAGALHAAVAETAGAAVPKPLPPIDRERQVWRETAVAGTNAALFLRGRPRRLPAVIRPLVAWLEDWQLRTQRESVLDGELLDAWVREPLAGLRSSLTSGGAYEARLDELCRRAAGPVPLVTMHGDLTMANVLVQTLGREGRTRIGVVDWETARTDALPLLDLFYMFADAAAAVGGYADRPGSARQCFSTGGIYAASASSARSRLARTLRLSEHATALCFHACWLHHAANEAREGGPGEARPFLEILDWVARSPDLLPGLAAP